MELCRLENVSKIYNMGEKVCPLKEIYLKVESGNFLSIEGPSGTGKSTLLYIMSGLLKATEGEVFLLGNNLKILSDKTVTEIRRTKVGFVFQEPNLFQALTVEGNLKFTYEIGKVTNSNDGKINELLEELGLRERRHFLPSQLSVGQRRRLVIARSLINNPPLILADEPTNDLDNFWTIKVMELLSRVVEQGGAVVMVTHNNYWAQTANKHFLLREGRLTLC